MAEHAYLLIDFHKRIRVSGDVEKESIRRGIGDNIEFVLVSDYNERLKVMYKGTDPLSDTFKYGASVVADGTLYQDGVFRAFGVRTRSWWERRPGGAPKSLGDFTPALIKKLRDPDQQVRRRAADGIAQIGPEAIAAVPALIEALRDPLGKHFFLRESAESALRQIGYAQPKMEIPPERNTLGPLQKLMTDFISGEIGYPSFRRVFEQQFLDVPHADFNVQQAVNIISCDCVDFSQALISEAQLRSRLSAKQYLWGIRT